MERNCVMGSLIFVLLLLLGGCDQSSQKREELVRIAKNEYELNEMYYDYSATIKAIDDPVYAYVGWVEIKNSTSGEMTRRVQYQYSKKDGKWSKTLGQMQTDLRDKRKKIETLKAMADEYRVGPPR